MALGPKLGIRTGKVTGMGNKLEELSNLGEGLNALGQNIQISLDMSKRDRRKNLAIILYSHVLSLFQSILREVDAEQLAEACARLPDIIDSSFAAVAVIKNPATADCFFDEHDVQRIYRRNAYQTLPRDINGKIRYLSGQHFARQAGMTEYFAAINRVLWDNEETVRVNCAGYRSGSATAAPQTSMQLMVLLPACESMFLATRLIADYFGIRNLDKEYYEYWQSYANLVGQCRAA